MKKLFLFAVPFALLSAPAAADPPEAETGSRLRPRSDILYGHYNEQEARRIAAQMIGCSAGIVTGRGRMLLQAELGSERENQLASGLVSTMSSCLTTPVQVRVSVEVVRGGVAEALFKKDFPEGLPETSSWKAVREYKLDPEMSDGERARIARNWMAACTVANDPKSVEALFATDIAAPAEMQALRAIVPAIAPCVPEGVTLELKPESLRGVLAEELYRFAVVQRDGASSPWAAGEETVE